MLKILIVVTVLGTGGPFSHFIILQVAFRQNSDISKLCSVASNESFVSFLTLMSCTGKRLAFYKQEDVFLLCKYVLNFFWLLRKPRKIKKHKVYSYDFL